MGVWTGGPDPVGLGRLADRRGAGGAFAQHAEKCDPIPKEEWKPQAELERMQQADAANDAIWNEQQSMATAQQGIDFIDKIVGVHRKLPGKTPILR